MTTAPNITLDDGQSIPMLGFGTWPLTNEEAEKATRLAIESGYRLIDTASRYGNEAGVGRGVRTGDIPRSELVVTTKLRGADHGYERTLAGCKASLDLLGLDYVDLYLIHWPLPSKNLYVDTWKAMIKLQKDGLVRSIGVSNFQPQHIERLITETGVAPVLNQVELHPEFAQPELRAFDTNHRIVTEAWSPLGRGETLHHETITSIATKHGRSPAQIVLRWHFELGVIAIPKSQTRSRIRENIDIFGFELDAADRERIGRLDRGLRLGGNPDVYEEE